MKTVIGLTGGIGSGKTAASNWFKEQGIVIVDADVIAREIVQPHSHTLLTIKKTFGDWVLNVDGSLNRAKLREHIFTNKVERQKLEKITHPAIRKKIEHDLKGSESKYTVLVVPLLFEGGKDGLIQLCNRVLVVDVSRDVQIERASGRDEKTKEHIEKIIESQVPRKLRIELADDVVDNTKDLEYLYSQLKPLHNKYLNLSGNY